MTLPPRTVPKMTSKSLFLPSWWTWALAAFAAGPASAGPVSLNPESITALRSLVSKDLAARAQYDKLRAVADRALAENPKPAASIVSQGTLQSDPDKVASNDSLTDMPEIEALAWTWAVTGDDRYGAKGRDYINAWASINQSDGNPINETKFQPLFIAYDLLRGSFPAPQRLAVDRWLKKKADMTWSTTTNKTENYQSHRIMVVSMIGETIGDSALVGAGIDGFRRQVNVNLRPDGSSLDFRKRDAMHYHIYDVRPLLAAACALKTVEPRLFTFEAANGSSLKRSVDFIVPYAYGQRQHIEFENSMVKFDRKRAESGEKAYKPHEWNPKLGIPAFSQAACLNPEYDAIASRVAQTAGVNSKFVDWQSVRNEAALIARDR